MFVKMLNILVFIFLEGLLISEGVFIENEKQIVEIIEKIVAEKTSELTNIIVNQQRQIERLEKQDQRKDRTIMNIIKSLTDMRREMNFENIKAVKEENHNSNSHTDNEIENVGISKVNVSPNSNNVVSTIRPKKHKIAGMRRPVREAETVAFSSYLSHVIDHMGVGHHIVFDKVLTNDGAGYNANTGVFTVPVTGLYLFTFSINVHFHYSTMQLVVDGKNIVDVIDFPVNNIESMSSNTAILHVNSGQSVWIQEYNNNDGSIFSTDVFRYCTFSGVRLN